MQWEMLTQEDGYRQVRVEAPWEEIAPDYDDILKDYRRVRIPGFRPGKAPLKVIEQRCRREISDRISRRGAQRLGRLALEQAGAEAAGHLRGFRGRVGKGPTLPVYGAIFPFAEIRASGFPVIKSRGGER